MKRQFQLPLPSLLYFVKESCHTSLHDTLSELRDIVRGLEASALTDFVSDFIRELQRHLALEENSLFQSPHASEKLIDHLILDHEEMRQGLLKLRKMTANYASESSSFYDKLREMDRIILNHIQIEDHILFPMVRKTS